MSNSPTYEMYTLILKHQIIADDGKPINLEEPYVIRFCSIFGDRYSSPVSIGLLMNRFKSELLQKLAEENE